VNKKVDKLKKSRYSDLSDRDSQQSSGAASSYDDSDSKIDEYIDDDKALLKLLTGADGLNF
jgi:hypothetical protein